jgi:uncharacterized membrane protein
MHLDFDNMLTGTGYFQDIILKYITYIYTRLAKAPFGIAVSYQKRLFISYFGS